MTILRFARDLNWDQIQHFKPKEFDDPDYPGSWRYMKAATVIYLDELRELTGWKIITHNKHGVHGCVCVTRGHHSPNSFHNYDNPQGCSAVDWHFITDADPEQQAEIVIRKSKFMGIGLYPRCWHWPGIGLLPIGFHTDLRPYFCLWRYSRRRKDRGDDPYVYLL